MFKFEVEVDDLVVCFEGDVGKSGMSEVGLIKMVEDCVLDYLDNEVDIKLMSYDGLDEVDDVKNYKVVYVGWK